MNWKQGNSRVAAVLTDCTSHFSKWLDQRWYIQWFPVNIDVGVVLEVLTQCKVKVNLLVCARIGIFNVLKYTLLWNYNMQNIILKHFEERTVWFLGHWKKLTCLDIFPILLTIIRDLVFIIFTSQYNIMFPSGVSLSLAEFYLICSIGFYKKQTSINSVLPLCSMTFRHL